jgi:hypothetical protein
MSAEKMGCRTVMMDGPLCHRAVPVMMEQAVVLGNHASIDVQLATAVAG